ncbi:MAG TPA: F0F1 ATP synthase subunit A [Planctomycetota bacterium]|nr:F0F1 ATP synthase subunit A [Planctomycetota bacterium]
MSPIPVLAADLISHVTNSDDLHFGPWHFGIPGISKHVEIMLLAALIVAVVAIATARAAVRAQGRGILANSVEATCLFLRDEVVRPGIGDHHTRAFFPLFATFFFFILVNNLLGLLPPPLGATATGNIWVTAGLATVTLGAMLGAGMWEKGVFKYWVSIVPHGVPGFMWPLVWVIELVGHFVKPFALTVRLFANMTAGHVILAVLGTFLIAGSQGFFTGETGLAAWLGLKLGVGLPTLGFALFIVVFETLVAFIQAYIFTTLSSIFVGQCLSHEH